MAASLRSALGRLPTAWRAQEANLTPMACAVDLPRCAARRPGTAAGSGGRQAEVKAAALKFLRCLALLACHMLI